MPGANSIRLSNSTAFAICDGLLRMSHCFILELPEPELKEIRRIVDSLLMTADLALDLMETDVSLNFDGLSIHPEYRSPPGAEDFGAVLVSSTITTSPAPQPSISSARRRGTISCPSSTSLPLPAPVRVPTPAPGTDLVQIPPKNHGRHPLVLSSRDNVGFPDYTYHPQFVQPGVPGTYRIPPTAQGCAADIPYYAVTKGLYVGIFTNHDEVRPWVFGISGSLYRMTKSWEEARDFYNARLASGLVQILS